MIVVPAPLETSIDTFVSNVQRLSHYYSRFQVDIADGKFVPNVTIQIVDFIKEYSNFPNHLQYDFHLMVEDPLWHISQLQNLSKSNLGVVLIHASVFPSYKLLVTTYPHMKFGLVLNPEDSVESVEQSFIKTLSSIQIMTVIPGFQGQPFIPNMLHKIEQLRNRGFSGEILIDGAVNKDTLPTILNLSHKPDILGIGSFLTKADDVMLAKRVEFLRSQLVPGNKTDQK